MEDNRPHGFLTVPDGTDPEVMAELRERFLRAGGKEVVVVTEGAEYWHAPDPQAAFTLRSVMSAHQAARQNLARLRRQQAADIAAAADDGRAGALLSNTARVELTRQQIGEAEAREAEVRAELAEAHARATGQPMPEAALSGGVVYVPGTVSAAPQASLRAAQASLRAAQAQLQAAQHAEQKARGELLAITDAVATMHRKFAHYLRVHAAVAVGGIIVGGVAVSADFLLHGLVAWLAWMIAVVAIATAVEDTRKRKRTAAKARAHYPRFEANHDVALRRLIAAEAGVLAAGGDLIPSTLDPAVERAGEV